MTLLPIPYQKAIKLTPHTLGLLLAASKRLGRNITLASPDGGWRSYATQEHYWDINGHDPAKANDPDKGDRVHMRGAGIDPSPYPSDVRQALIDVGFIPDKNERWHFSDPQWRSMPIIKTDTGTAGNPGEPTTGDDTMSAAEVKAIIDNAQAMHDATRAYLAGLINGNAVDTRNAVNIMVQRATRYRLYTNETTGARMAVNLNSGDVIDITDGDGQIQSLQDNFQLIGHGEQSVTLNGGRWAAMLDICARVRGEK